MPTPPHPWPCVLALLAACPSQPDATPDGSSSTTADPSTTSSVLTTSASSTSTTETTDLPTTTTTAPADTSSETTDGTSTTTSTTSTLTTTGDPDPALPLIVDNPGFESDFVADGAYDDAIVPAGWTPYDPQSIIGQDYNSLGILNPTGTILYPDGAPEGSNVALVFLWRDQTSGVPAGFEQQLAHVLMPATQYTLRVQVGNIAPEMGVPYDLGGFPGYRVELLAGATLLAADDDTLAPAEGAFQPSEVVYTAAADDPALGQPLTIRLVNLNKADAGIEVNFDDVSLLAGPAP